MRGSGVRIAKCKMRIAGGSRQEADALTPARRGDTDERGRVGPFPNYSHSAPPFEGLEGGGRDCQKLN
jgi:hypothetical protein